MYCLHPINVKKWAECSDGTKVKTNNYHLVPCGKCVACLARRRAEWTFRLSKELDFSSYGLFITLTYDQANIPIKIVDGKPYYCFDKSHIQKYIKRVRYFIDSFDMDLHMTYYLVSEYGSYTHRPHYHALVFVKNDDYAKFLNNVKRILSEEWRFGFSVIKPIMPSNIHYVTKYCVKALSEEFEDTCEDVFVMCSKKSYLGCSFERIVEEQNNLSNNKPLVYFNGYKQAMPRIYREKTGIGSKHGSDSPDPRLDLAKYNKYKQEFLNRYKIFDEKQFADFLNVKLYYYEKQAKQKQINRLEKL